MPAEMVTGNQAAAHAVQRAGVDLIAAYPITPQTTVIETLAGLWARGELQSDYVTVESEYSALALCSGAAAAGARTFTATSSHGLIYMHEMIHWCAGARYPMVLVNVNRAVGAPWSLEPDQGDSLSQRDTGWLQLYCSNAQEIFDTILQAYLLSEELLLPCMVVYDGFYISHTYESVNLLSREEVGRFLQAPNFKPQVDPGNPANLHGLIGSDQLSSLIRERRRDMQLAAGLYADINQRYATLFGRSYSCVEETALEEARYAIVTAGSCAETVQWALGELPGCALIRLKMVRPFPEAELCSLLNSSKVKKLLVIDRSCSPGQGGILAQEVKAALYGKAEAPEVHSLILAGGTDLTLELLQKAVRASFIDKNFDNNSRAILAEENEFWGIDLC